MEKACLVFDLGKALSCLVMCLDLTRPGVELIKLFWRKFTYSICKPDLFLAMQQKMLHL
jgi:hypothetical protein